MSCRLAAVVLAGLACSCATAAKPRVVDLQPARRALEEARAEGAPERAPETFTRAEGELKKAEQLVAESGADAPLAAVEAEWAARLALSEARCVARDAATAGRLATVEEVRRLEARARSGEDDKRRLEEQLALRQRELEVTETELIRTKARLKGLETRAEASSAIAEARILVERAKQRGRSAAVATADKSLDQAEAQLNDGNYGAALFFALKAQGLLTKAVEGGRSPVPAAGADSTGPERPAPQATYEVAATTANIREAPSTDSRLVGQARRGTRLAADIVRGTWVKVKHGDVEGWVSLKLLQ